MTLQQVLLVCWYQPQICHRHKSIHVCVCCVQVHDFIEEALPANSKVNDAALQKLVDRFIAQGMAAQTASEGLASQTSMSLDAFFAACHTSQVLLQDPGPLLGTQAPCVTPNCIGYSLFSFSSCCFRHVVCKDTYQRHQ